MLWEELKNTLLQPGFWPQAGPVELIETHISGVFLVGDRAYKVKKPVDLGFVNFSTLAQRKQFYEAELRLNSRLAPDLYLRIVTITDAPSGPEFEGDGETLEYAIEMVRFDQASLMVRAEEAGNLTDAHMDQLAELIADFHARCPVATADQPFGEPRMVGQPIAGNFEHLLHKDLPEVFYERLIELQVWSRDEQQRLEPVLLERKAGGFVRECHGDMHLGNMILVDDKITIFDCIEFNESFRWTDVLSEVAFCTMDLTERGQTKMAHHLLNRYLELTGDYAGLTVLPYYLCYRALVRAKVAWLRLEQHPLTEFVELWNALEDYIALAEKYAFDRKPKLIVMHGVSGTGKSFGGEQIVHALGAIRIRSDAERKRIANETPRDEEVDLYDPSMTRATYDRLHQFAQKGLQAGFPILLDATYLRADFRKVAQRVAETLNVPIFFLHLTASEQTLRERLRTRQSQGIDPSDADERILEMQLKTVEPLTEQERELTISINTEQPDCWSDVISRLNKH